MTTTMLDVVMILNYSFKGWLLKVEITFIIVIPIF